MTATIKCKVVADRVWLSSENRMLKAGDIVEFPAQVKNHEGKLVDFKVGESFEIVKDEKSKSDAGEKIKAEIAKLEASLAKAGDAAKPDIQAKIDAKKKELDALTGTDLV